MSKHSCAVVDKLYCNISKDAIIIAGLSVATVLLGWQCSIVFSRKNTLYDPTDNDHYSVIHCITTERNNLNYACSISTVTFYDGKLDSDIIQARVSAVLTANPWLCARLQTVQGSMKAVYPRTYCPESISQHFKRISYPSLASRHNYSDIVKSLQKFEVPMGFQCINQPDASLFLVTLLEIVPDEKYALLVSLSHILGDGHTYYALYAMLDPNVRPVQTLDPTRVEDYEYQLHARFDRKLLAWLNSKLVLGGVLYGLFFARKADVGVFSINDTAIQRAKEEALQSFASSTTPKIISTNDVITSWCLQQSQCPFGLMALNLRNRFEGIHEGLAGNYENVIVYRSDDSSHPGDIRASLSSLHSRSNTIMSMWQTLTLDLCGITNWASFYTADVCFPSARLTLHLPVVAPNTIFTRAMAILFRPSRGRLGIVLMDREQPLDVWRRAPVNFLQEQLL